MRGIVSVITLATIGASLSMSRGDEKPTTRPASPHDTEISELRDRVERLSIELESERKQRIVGVPLGRPMPVPAESERTETFRLPPRQQAELSDSEIRRLREILLGELDLARSLPATRPNATQPNARQRLEELRSELEKRGEELRKQETQIILRTTPDDMPHGSSPRAFNGFTYYIVPLGK